MVTLRPNCVSMILRTSFLASASNIATLAKAIDELFALLTREEWETQCSDCGLTFSISEGPKVLSLDQEVSECRINL